MVLLLEEERKEKLRKNHPHRAWEKALWQMPFSKEAAINAGSEVLGWMHFLNEKYAQRSHYISLAFYYLFSECCPMCEANSFNISRILNFKNQPTSVFFKQRSHLQHQESRVDIKPLQKRELPFFVFMKFYWCQNKTFVCFRNCLQLWFYISTQNGLQQV